MPIFFAGFFFFFNDTATTEIYTLSLHDALPILRKFKLSENADMFAGNLYRSGALRRLGLGFKRIFALSQAGRLHCRGGIAPAQEVAPLAADCFAIDILSCLGLKETAGRFSGIGAERAR